MTASAVGGPGSVAAPADLCAHVERLRAAFGAGSTAGPAPIGARYEAYVRSAGPSGALVDAAPATAAPYAAAIARLGTVYQQSVLHAVLRGTAARRRVLKYGIDGGMSVFHAVDVPTDKLPRLAEGFGAPGGAARRVRDALLGAGLAVCGWAVEVPRRPHQAMRLRCYAMVAGGDGPEPLLHVAAALGLRSSARRSLSWYWSRLAGAGDVVVNLGLTHGGSVKAEFPNPPVAVLYDVPPPRDWVDDVERLAGRLETSELDQLGVRWTADCRPELCAYLAVEGRPA